MTLKLVITASCMTLRIKGDSVKDKPASSFVVPFGTTHGEISHLGVADR